MFKRLLINWVLPAVMEALISALVRLADKTETQVDDKVVDAILKDKDAIISEIKASL